MKLKILLIFLIPLNAILEDQVIETTPELLCQACKAKQAECGMDAECFKEACKDSAICNTKESTKTQAEQLIHESEKKIKNGYKENIEPIINQVEEKIEETWDQTKGKSKSFVESTKEFAENFYEGVKNFVKPNFTENLCENCKKENINCEDCIREKCKGEEECLKGYYQEEMMPKAGKIIEDAQNEVKRMYEKAKEQIPSNKDINENAEKISEKVKDFAGDVGEKIKETVEPVIEGTKKIYNEKIEPKIKDIRENIPQPNVGYLANETKDRLKVEFNKGMENLEQTVRKELGIYFGIPTILLMVLVATGAYFIVKRKKVHTA